MNLCQKIGWNLDFQYQMSISINDMYHLWYFLKQKFSFDNDPYYKYQKGI
jgi:hypothetical protein